MGKLNMKLAAIPLAGILMFAAVVPGYASSVNAGLGSGSSQTTTGIEASYLIPIERTKNEIDGELVITEVFEVPASVDPYSLVREDFVQDNVLYSEESIIKTPFTETDTIKVSLPFELATDTDDMTANIQKLPYNMKYDVDGYVGELYLNPQSITVTVTEQETKYSTKKEVQTFTLEDNSPSSIPDSYNGLPLKDVSWSDGEYFEGSSIPSYYVATATYSKTSSWKADSAWTLTAQYEGSATYENTSNLKYTIKYKGEVIPDGYEVVDGALVLTEKAPNILLPVLLVLALLLLLIASVIGLLYAIKRGLIVSRRLTVQAMDDQTGEYRVIQKAHINKKAPMLKLDTLKMPSSRHFLCELSAPKAKQLRGKIITIMADGSLVTKHQINPFNDTDKYTFTIDLEPVDSGPVDHSAL